MTRRSGLGARDGFLEGLVEERREFALDTSIFVNLVSIPVRFFKILFKSVA